MSLMLAAARFACAAADEPVKDGAVPPLPARAIAQLGDTAFRHNNPINGIAYSSDGKRIATTAFNPPNHGAYVWDAGTGQLVRHLRPETGETVSSTCVAWSPDGSKIAAGDQQGNVTIWDAATGKILYAAQRHARSVSGVAFVPNRSLLVSAGADGQVRLLDIRNPDLPEDVRDWSVYLPNEKLPEEDTPERVWHAAGALAVSANGRQVAAARIDNANVFVWDVASGRRVTTIAAAVKPDPAAPPTIGAAATVAAIAFIDEGRQLLVSGHRNVPSDKTKLKRAPKNLPVLDLQRWNIADAKPVGGQPADEMYSFGGMAASADGRLFATSDANAIHVWKTGDERPLRTFNVPGLWSAPLAFSRDGKTLAAGTGLFVSLWGVESGERHAADGELRILEGIHAASWSPDGQRLLIGFNGGVQLWDAPSCALLRTLLMGEPLGPFDRTGQAWRVAFSPDGSRLIASGSRDDEDVKKYRVGNVRLWDAASGKQLREIVTELEVRDMVLSPDGTHACLATNNGGFDSYVVLVELATGNVLARLPDTPAGDNVPGVKGLVTFRFAPDGQHVYFVEAQGGAFRWNPTDGTIDQRFVADPRVEDRDRNENPKLWIGGATFTPDGRTLCAAAGSVLGCWETSTGKRTRSQRFEGRSPYLRAMSPDGKKLATTFLNHAGGAFPTTVMVWDVATGKELLELEPQRRAHVMAFSPDGSKLATAAYEGIVTVWDVR